MEKVTIDLILGYLKTAVENKSNLTPTIWIDSAMKLNTLLGDEYGRLYDLKKEVSLIKLDFLSQTEKRNVSEANLKTEATETYRLCKIQEMKCKTIEEFIRIAKLMSRVNAGM